MKLHYLYESVPGLSAIGCDRLVSLWRDRSTRDPEAVTCKRCQGSPAYKEAMAEHVHYWQDVGFGVRDNACGYDGTRHTEDAAAVTCPRCRDKVMRLVGCPECGRPKRVIGYDVPAAMAGDFCCCDDPGVRS